MSRQPFYDAVTASLYKGSLPDFQRRPIDALIDEGVRRGQHLERIAYILATAHHETARFKYVEELGEGDGRAYGVDVPLMGTGSKVTRWARFHGRGFVQTTWLSNYAKISIAATLDFQRPIDLVNNPNLLETDEGLMSFAIWHGMFAGIYTGRNLADYIDADGVDYVGARKIVNGTDKDELIARYAEEFEAALKLIGSEPVVEGCARTGCPFKMEAA